VTRSRASDRALGDTFPVKKFWPPKARGALRIVVPGAARAARRGASRAGVSLVPYARKALKYRHFSIVLKSARGRRKKSCACRRALVEVVAMSVVIARKARWHIHNSLSGFAVFSIVL
jgi:hypothetical protein